MKTKAVIGYEADDIRKQVNKVLRRLGNPEPPVHLDDVRDLLSLDRDYFRSDDDGALREVVSRVRVAGKQLARRPTLLIDVIRKADISALWIPDRRRILIDESKPKLKHRWSEAHEIGHSLIPWHEEFLFGDNEYSLNPTCHEAMEAEANFAAGQLLFLGSRFFRDAKDLQLGFEAVTSLKARYKNTLTSTLWRYVEEARPELPMVGLVSVHPHHSDALPSRACRYFVQSRAFRDRFSEITEAEVFEALATYCSYRRRGPLGSGEVVLTDDSGQSHVFLFESFSNSYDVLTLGMYSKPRATSIAVG